jgi:cyclopropane-fatty-acyl-phospholipid synthase
MKVDGPGASVEAIRFHYDVGNEFYRLWLDPSMTYTCALFAGNEPEEKLGEAQVRKMDYHIAQTGAAGRQCILDIGCGWGGMLRRFVGEHGVAHAVGLTLSEAQAEWMKSEPDPRIEVRVENWMDHRPRQPYDAIVSIEAIEAFARLGLSTEEKVAVYASLFDRCHAWLRPGGRMSLQVIAYGNSGPEDFDPFIAAQIFPESDLPRLAEIASAIERRFEVTSLVNDRKQYVRTLRAWLRRLRSRRTEAVHLAGEDTVRRYEEYLDISIVAFASGSCDLYRIALQRIDRPRIVPGVRSIPHQEDLRPNESTKRGRS